MMRKTRIIGISALSAGMALLVLIMAHYAVAWANMTSFDGPVNREAIESVTPIQMTLDSGWIDVMQWAVAILFVVAIAAGFIAKSYGLLAVIGTVSFTASAFFEQLLTEDLSVILLGLALLTMISALVRAVTDDRRIAVVPKAPDYGSDAEIRGTTRSHGGGWGN